MTFFNHLMDCLAYLLSRSYAVWYFSIPVTMALIWIVFHVLRFERRN